MKLGHIKRMPICSAKIGLVLAVLMSVFLFLDSGLAEIKPEGAKPQKQMRKDSKAVSPMLKLCPDLDVRLSAHKSGNGIVTLNGTISNKGVGDYNNPSEARIFMNLSYPPKTYAQVGVSEKLCTKAFTQLKNGATFDFQCTYQIPDFEKWVDDMVVSNAIRLFTLSVVKADMSPFAPGEECNEKNNSKSLEVKYQAKKN